MARLVGKVVRDAFAPGSKSEHGAVYLESGGQRYVLRRQGGNPFADPRLDALVGHSIETNGQVLDYTFLMDDWQVLPD